MKRTTSTTGRLLSLVLAASLLAACGDSFTPEDVAGIYNLDTVNGSPIPFTKAVTEGGLPATAQIISGSVTLTAANTFSSIVSFNVTVGTTVDPDSDTESGTYALVEPSTITFTKTGGGTFSGTLDGGRITVALSVTTGADTFVFRKS